MLVEWKSQETVWLHFIDVSTIIVLENQIIQNEKFGTNNFFFIGMKARFFCALSPLFPSLPHPPLDSF